jgi:hypothetical protein
MERQLVYFHSAVHKIMHKEIGQIGNNQSIRQKPQRLFLRLHIFPFEKIRRQANRAANQKQIDDMRQRKRRNRNSRIKMGIAKQLKK